MKKYRVYYPIDITNTMAEAEVIAKGIYSRGLKDEPLEFYVTDDEGVYTIVASFKTWARYEIVDEPKKPPESTEYHPDDGPFWAAKWTGIDTWSVKAGIGDNAITVTFASSTVRQFVDSLNRACRKWAEQQEGRGG